MNSPQPNRPAPPVVWWIIWAAITIGLAVIYGAIPPTTPKVNVEAIRYLPLLPLAAAVIVRWLILPRLTDAMRAFPIFIVGLALAEGCGIFGIFLVPDLRQTYFTLALLGLVQFAPFFAAKYSRSS